MTFNYKSILGALIGLLFVASCDVLDQEPQLQVDPGRVFTSESLARSAVNGLYDAMQDPDYYGAGFQYSSDNYSDVSFYAGFIVAYLELDNHLDYDCIPEWHSQEMPDEDSNAAASYDLADLSWVF